MGEIQSSKMGELYSSVSREFSDAERAIQDEVSDVLQAPVFTADEMVPTGVAYSLMREDMKMRAAQNEELAQRQKIAFADSARSKLHQDAIRQNKQSEDTNFAATQMNELINERGMSVAEAISFQVKENPQRATSPFYIEFAKALGPLVEEPHEKFMRENGEEFHKLKLSSETLNMQLAVETGKLKVSKIDSMIEAMETQLENVGIAGDNEQYRLNLDNLKLQKDFMVSQDKYSELTEFMKRMGQAGENPVALLEEISGFWGDKNMGSVDWETFIPGVRISGPTEGELLFLTDDRSLRIMATRKGLADPADVAERIAVLGNADMHTAAAGGDSESARLIAEARSWLREGAGVYHNTYKDSINTKARLDKMKEFSTTLSKKYSETISNIRQDLLSQGDDIENENFTSASHRANQFINELSIELDVPLRSQFDVDDKRTILKANGEVLPSDITDDEIGKKGEELGLWIDDVNIPTPDVDSNGKINTDEYDTYLTELTSWIDRKVNIIDNMNQPSTPKFNSNNNNNNSKDNNSDLNKPIPVGGAGINDNVTEFLNSEF